MQRFQAFVAIVFALMDEIWGLNGSQRLTVESSFEARESREVIAIMMDDVHYENDCFSIFQDLLLLIVVISEPMP